MLAPLKQRWREAGVGFEEIPWNRWTTRTRLPILAILARDHAALADGARALRRRSVIVWARPSVR